MNSLTFKSKEEHNVTTGQTYYCFDIVKPALSSKLLFRQTLRLSFQHFIFTKAVKLTADLINFNDSVYLRVPSTTARQFSTVLLATVGLLKKCLRRSLAGLARNANILNLLSRKLFRLVLKFRPEPLSRNIMIQGGVLRNKIRVRFSSLKRKLIEFLD